MTVDSAVRSLKGTLICWSIHTFYFFITFYQKSKTKPQNVMVSKTHRVMLVGFVGQEFGEGRSGDGLSLLYDREDSEAGFT